MDEQTMIYIGLTSMIAFFVLLDGPSFKGLGVVVSLLSLLAIVMIFIINYVDYIPFTIFTRLFGIRIIPASDYYIPRSADSVVKYTSNLYYATGYLTGNIYNYVFTAESVEEEEELKLSEAPDKWERIVMNVSFPFKFNIIATAQDVQDYREMLEGKRGVYEYQISKEMMSSNPNPLTIESLQTKINVLGARIDRISRGERPIDTIMYVETTAVGVSEKEAVDKLTSQLNHLQTLFNSFDLHISRVIGREIYHLFNFNYQLPSIGFMRQTFGTQR